MHVSLLNQWDCHLQDQKTIVFRSFLEISFPTSCPITTCFTKRQRLRCLFGAYWSKVSFSLVPIPSLHQFFLLKKNIRHGTSALTFEHLITSQSRISFQFLFLMTFLMSFMVLIFSPSWIFVLGITKFGFMRMISLKLIFSHMMATMNFLSCHLASWMLLPNSRHWWVKYSGPTCKIYLWSCLMISSSIVKHGLLISNIWIM